ncbi:MAG: alanine racemase [Clostridia bacterium]|nr:alanine racemase [Clostridia bacterium]
MIVTVHTSRIINNLDAMRLAYGKPLIFMCKANAYGHGMREVAPCVPAKAYGVATAEEGALLRSYVSAPILVTAPRISNIPLIAESDLIPLVGEESYVCALAGAKVVKRCHIKADSGMHRSGISSPKKCYEAATLLAEGGVTVEGICTHYKDASKDTVLSQNARFDECVQAVRSALFARGQSVLPYTHVTSSGAALAARYDAIRVGLSAYGYENERRTGRRLTSAMEVFSEILNVKRLRKGDTLGYEGAFIADRPLTACTVLGGYADGMDRRDVGGEVIVKGRRARIAAVCMDTFEVVSDAVDFCVGDRVIILSDEINAQEIAIRRGSIPYEVLVGFDTPRAERRYD